MLGRDASNHPVSVAIQSPLAVGGVVTATELASVIPNPAPGRALVAYSLAKAGPVDLSVYSVDGRRVTTLAHGVQDAGRYQVTWKGIDARGVELGAGMYFVRLEAAGIRRTRLVTLVR